MQEGRELVAILARRDGRAQRLVSWEDVRKMTGSGPLDWPVHTF